MNYIAQQVRTQQDFVLLSLSGKEFKNFIISSANSNSFELKVNDMQQICKPKNTELGNTFG